MQEAIASALAQLARLDVKAAQVAENALTTLTAGGGLESLSQYRVQEFCWYVLPVRFTADSGDRDFAARSLGHVFTLLNLERYADLCTSHATERVLHAYSISHETGLCAYRRAMRASGVEPPDLTELTWGTALGTAEIDAYQATSAALELAIALEDVRPGARGWRTAQAQHAHAFLTQPDQQGRSHLDRVREERVRNWLGSPSHPHRQQLWPLLGQIIAGAEPPPNAAGALAPVRRLLDYADEGIGLTQIGYISPTAVRELCAEFDWSSSPSPARSETDVMQLIALHKLLRTMRAVRRSGRRLVLTRRGRRLHGDTDALWRAVAEGVLDTDGFEQAAAETLLGLLLVRLPRPTGNHARDDDADITSDARLILADAGWAGADSDDGPETQQLQSVLINATWLLETLGFIAGRDQAGEGGPQYLTKAGRAFALTATHLSATAPATSI
ncbi:hypothetical protein F4561_000679 [Lipingzhangella halophila]|uniref:Uncharacterized protein n=1 Tax=Lipingzhangella halophila TaxID=1783352 RepID=A0A7W7RDD0_9ACTN|nr:hypothetical protein [Lipingzhangella halophila]MBB4929859.1 hypothetical protein [Lipingzhangella halophila]